MQRNFNAEIYINTSKDVNNIVKIIPFFDSDKQIAFTLQKVINHSIQCDNDLDLDRDDCFRSLTFENR